MLTAVYRRSFSRAAIGVATLLLTASPTRSDFGYPNYDDSDLFAVVGVAFDVSYTVGTAGGPPPQSVVWNSSNGALPSGVNRATVVRAGSPGVYDGVRVFGTAAAPSFGVYKLDIAQYHVSGAAKLNLVVFSTAALRSAAQTYTDLMRANAANVNYYYWAALRGYTIGIGVGDEGLALYSYYSSLGGYYYTAYAASSPRLAAYYYWYYQGLAFYYFYDRHGDNATAVSQFAYYVGLANASL